jgi:hypothetical protein
MSDPSHGDAVRAATGLRLALDRLSEACIFGDLEQLLAAEAGLAVALSYLQTPLAPPADPTLLVLEVEALRRALQRAERVGASFDDMVRGSIGVLAPVALYDREGRERAGSHEPALEARG